MGRRGKDERVAERMEYLAVNAALIDRAWNSRW
jgi:hypothetical protein